MFIFRGENISTISFNNVDTSFARFSDLAVENLKVSMNARVDILFLLFPFYALSQPYYITLNIDSQVMKLKIPFIAAILMSFFSCNQQQEQTRPNVFAPKVVEAKGYIVPKDNMAIPKVVIAGKPKSCYSR